MISEDAAQQELVTSNLAWFEEGPDRKYVSVSRTHYEWLAALTAHEANSVSLDTAELERLMRGYQLECNECEQIAGKALGYPWYKDDQKNCPGATEADGVCVGEHVPSSVVAELARRYTEANSVRKESSPPEPKGKVIWRDGISPGNAEFHEGIDYPEVPDPKAAPKPDALANSVSPDAARLLSEAYQVVAILAERANVFNDPQVQKTLDLLHNPRWGDETESMLPFQLPERASPPEPDALVVIEAARPWERCPSTHCERRQECASPSDCIVKSAAYDKAKRPTPAASDGLVERLGERRNTVNLAAVIPEKGDVAAEASLPSAHLIPPAVAADTEALVKEAALKDAEAAVRKHADELRALADSRPGPEGYNISRRAGEAYECVTIITSLRKGAGI